jgi:alpha-L-fucosidase
MKISRRDAIINIAGAAALLRTRSSFAQSSALEIEKGPFDGTREGLQAYEIPEWFRDAKFGIWSHWGPQSAAEDGDWYARNIYIQGSRQNKNHLARFGHPSKFGHKDICKIWTADKFDPDHLIGPKVIEVYKLPRWRSVADSATTRRCTRQ